MTLAHKDLVNHATSAPQKNLHPAGYQTANAAATTAVNTMAEGDLLYQLDTNVWYKYDGAAWVQIVDFDAIATQAIMETGTSLTNWVPTGRQHFHPGHPKAWGYVTVAAGTPTLQTSYNLTSITDTATGQITFTIATDFSTANWCAEATIEKINTTLTVANLRYVSVRNGTIAAGTVVIECWDGTAVTANQVDPSSWHFMALGDQA